MITLDLNLDSTLQFHDFPYEKPLHGIAIAVYFAHYPKMEEGFYLAIKKGFFGRPDRVVYKNRSSHPVVNRVGKIWKFFFAKDPMNELCETLQLSMKWFRGDENYLSYLKETLGGLKEYQKKYRKTIPIQLPNTIEKIEKLLEIADMKKESIEHQWLKEDIIVEADLKPFYDKWKEDIKVLVPNSTNYDKWKGDLKVLVPNSTNLLEYFNTVQI